MNEMAFVAKREEDWRRLTLLCDRADISVRNLRPEELQEFVKLYRRISADLALVRTKSTNLQLIDFLNDLAGRAYSVLYREPRKPFGRAVGDSVALIAQTVRRCRAYVLASFLLLIGSAGLSFTLMGTSPETRPLFVPEQARPLFDSWKKGEFAEMSGSQASAMAGNYAVHNPLVSVITGSVAAATFGLGTVNYIYQNGVMLGALSYEMNSVGKLGFLYASILPHGVPELSGLIVSGSAGLVMGWALISPGRRKRGESLKAAGKDAIVLLVTGVLLMFIAAPIEGFFSFNPNVPTPLKVVVIAVELTFWGLFWVGFGRNEEEKAALA